jgi:ComF family protein
MMNFSITRQGITHPIVYQIRSWIDRGLTLLFPPRCVACERMGWSFCPHCAQAVEAVGREICWQCGRPQPQPTAACPICRQQRGTPANDGSLLLIRVAAIHAEPLRQAIHALKYRGRTELAAPLARYLVATLLDAPWTTAYFAVDGIVPVPLHAERQRERGYNQSALLAEAFCHRTALPLQRHWLSRQQPTRSQVGLTAAERHRNVEQAFVAHPAVQGKRVVVLDDVYTTGATLHACARALVRAGATAVYGLALACPR